jgi:cobalt-precorrin 5A hydrolase
MRVSCISFTAKGSALNKQISKMLIDSGEACQAYAMARYAEENGLKPLEEPLREWCGRMFPENDALIFIGACGIAVRGIAPYVKDKRTDPAVIVIDERANYVISLLSGHIGGANELTDRIARLTGAVPVVTTATDVNSTFAVDVFARKNDLHIDSMPYAKRVSAQILDGMPIGFFSAYPVEGRVPSALKSWSQGDPVPDTGVVVTTRTDMKYFPHTLCLYPKIVHVGVGCRKNTAFERIEKKILEALQLHHISVYAVASLASIDLKKDEQGILKFADKYNLEFHTYSSEELLAVEGEFTESLFVQSITGVSNVCERAAILDCQNACKELPVAGSAGSERNSRKTRIIQKKLPGDGVTVALAIEEWSVRFE